MEKETTDTSAQDQQDAEAAFAAGFDGQAQTATDTDPKPEPTGTPDPTPTPEPTPEPTQKPDAQAPEPLTAEEMAAFRAMAKDVPNLREQLRKVEGRIGSATDTLTKLQDARRSEGLPATMTAAELKQTQEAYPELAALLKTDLEQTLKNLRIAGPDPEEVTKQIDARVDAMVAERLKARDEAEEKRRVEERRDAVREVHEDFDVVIKSPEFWEWEKSQPQATRDAIVNSDKVSAITKVITQFKADKAAAAAKAAERSKRLEGAVNPQGERRTPGKQQLSDQEAMNKGFLEGFNS